MRGTFECAGFGMLTGLLTRIKAATLGRLAACLGGPMEIMIKVTPDPPQITLEESLLHVSELLRCAAATAYETGDSLNGPKRDLAFSVVHLIGMAKGELERSLARVEVR